jgi:hypothetical protein
LLKHIKHKFKNIAKSVSRSSIVLNSLPIGYLGCVDEVNKTCVSGWVSCIDQDLNPVALKITKGNEVKLAFADLIRSDVLRAGRAKTECCGYSVSFSKDNFERAKVEVLFPAGELTKIAPSYKGRKVFFIHIPKVAGSSVNDCISSAIEGRYYTHIEGFRGRWDEISDANFLSGHIRYKEYEREFSQSDYVVFAFFREPFSHVKSHMNWVRRLAEPALIDNRESHPSIVRKISDDLARLDFTDAVKMKSYVNNIKPTAYGLFDNCQVRYLSDVKPNERVTKKHLDQAIKNLQHLHFVGISEYSKESQFQLMSLLGLRMNKSETKSNVNSYDYGLNLSEAAIADALMPFVRFDIKLYEAAKSRFLMESRNGLINNG